MKNILSCCLLFLSFVCLAHCPEPSHQVTFSDALITAPTTTIKVVLNSTTNVVYVDIQKVSEGPTYTANVRDDISDVGFDVRKRSYKRIYTYQSVLNSKYHISVRAGNYCRDSVRV